MWVDLHNAHTRDVSARTKAKTPTPHVCAWCKYAHTARPRVGGGEDVHDEYNGASNYAHAEEASNKGLSMTVSLRHVYFMRSNSF